MLDKFLGKKPKKKKIVGVPFEKNDPRINRKGRPKLGNTLAEKYRDVGNEPVDPENPGYTVMDAAIDRVKEKALKGDLAAIAYMEARGWGKIPEVIELHTDDGDEIDFSQWSTDDLQKYEKLLKKYQENRG